MFAFEVSTKDNELTMKRYNPPSCRRFTLHLIILALILLNPVPANAAACPNPAPELGANYNQYIADIDPGLLARSKVKWVRTFVDIERNYLTFSRDGSISGILTSNVSQGSSPVSTPSENLAIYSINHFVNSKSVSVGGNPIKTIVSLKFDFKYRNSGVPRKNTKQMNDLLWAVAQFLTANNLGAHIDILVVGNEPMFETPTDQKDVANFGTFMNLLISEVASLKSWFPGWNYQIYVGALNKASTLRNDPILQQIISITNSNSAVAGLDLHEHVASLQEQADDLNFIRNTENVTKPIISTEFSLVGLWDAHENDTLGSWGSANGYASTTRVYEWINDLVNQAAAGSPISQDKFLSYFNSQSWYPQNWFQTMYQQFQCYDTYAVTYGLMSPIHVPPILYDKTSMLWYVNFLYNCTLLGMGADGYCNASPLLANDFQNAINGM